MSSPLLVAHTVHPTHAMGRVRLHGLRGGDLRAPAGAFVAVRGQAGSRKSTRRHTPWSPTFLRTGVSAAGRAGSGGD